MQISGHMIILDQTDQDHQIPQNISDAISKKLTSVVKKNLLYELEDFYSGLIWFRKYNSAKSARYALPYRSP